MVEGATPPKGRVVQDGPLFDLQAPMRLKVTVSIKSTKPQLHKELAVDPSTRKLPSRRISNRGGSLHREGFGEAAPG